MASGNPNLADLKAGLRKSVMARRNAVPLGSRSEAASAITERALMIPQLQQARVVGGYWPIRSEIDPRGLIEGLRQTEKVITLPVVLDSTRIDFRLWETDDDLVDAGFGTFAPGEAAPTTVPDVILAPMVGFDRRGIRLGYGGGYYDRYVERLIELDKRPFLIGIAHSCQEVEQVPNDVFDIALDCVVTEAELVVCSAGRLTSDNVASGAVS